MAFIQEISSSTNQLWEYSKTFISAVALVVSFIAWYTARQKLKQDVVPTLVFYRKTPTPGEKWIVKNVGLGPALNIQMREADQQGQWLDLNFPYPIGAKDYMELTDLHVAWQLKATYTYVGQSIFHNLR